MAEEISTLQDLFPTKTIYELETVLASADGDLSIACSMLFGEEDSVNSAGSKQMSETSETGWGILLDMFPNVDQKEIKRIYEENDNDVDVSIQHLLSFQLLSQEDLEHQKYYEEQALRREDANCSDKVWGSGKESTGLIVEYSGVSERIAKSAYYRNSFNASRALIDLIYNYKEYIKRDDKDISRPTTPNILANDKFPRVGGKVQSSRGFAHARDNGEKDLKSRECSPEIADSDVPLNSSYKYSLQNKEGIELEEILRSNIYLKSIKHTFFEKALEFYNGDVTKTILLGKLILDTNCAQYTYGYLAKPQYGTATTIKSVKKPVIRTTKVAHEEKTLNFDVFVDDESYKKGLTIVQDTFANYRADLHGFLPDEAVSIVRECLKKWWAEELILREQKAQRLNQRIIANVKPFTIITGRGIHSVGGVSKVRKKVKNFLENNSFVFLEEPSFFIVEGKK